MRINDWSSDVCSSDLGADQDAASAADCNAGRQLYRHRKHRRHSLQRRHHGPFQRVGMAEFQEQQEQRSEEHTSELQSLMRISYAVFCLKKKTKNKRTQSQYTNNNNTKQSNE